MCSYFRISLGNFHGHLEDEHCILSAEAYRLKLSSRLWVTYLSIFRSGPERFVNGENNCDENWRFRFRSLWALAVGFFFFSSLLPLARLFSFLHLSLTSWKHLGGLGTNGNHPIYYVNIHVNYNADDGFSQTPATCQAPSFSLSMRCHISASQ